MQDKRTILCGSAPADGTSGDPGGDLHLRLWGKDGPDKITLRIEVKLPHFCGQFTAFESSHI